MNTVDAPLPIIGAGEASNDTKKNNTTAANVVNSKESGPKKIAVVEQNVP